MDPNQQFNGGPPSYGPTPSPGQSFGPGPSGPPTPDQGFIPPSPQPLAQTPPQPNPQMPPQGFVPRPQFTPQQPNMYQPSVPQGPQTPGSFQPGVSNDLNTGQFDFITNPNQPAPKKNLVPGKGSKHRIPLLIGGGLIAVMILFIIGALLFGGGGNTGVNAQLFSIAQQQEEIARVAGIGVEKAGSPEAKKLAVMSRLIVTTDQQELLSYMDRAKIKYKAKEISAQKNGKTDQELETAEANGRFDEVFTRTITTALEEYKKDMQTVYSASENKKTKELLTEDITSIPLILGTEEPTTEG